VLGSEGWEVNGTCPDSTSSRLAETDRVCASNSLTVCSYTVPQTETYPVASGSFTSVGSCSKYARSFPRSPYAEAFHTSSTAGVEFSAMKMAERQGLSRAIGGRALGVTLSLTLNPPWPLRACRASSGIARD